ncbi:MAG TPA: GFA family protein, partial [Candidatus Binataceae bacterium]
MSDHVFEGGCLCGSVRYRVSGNPLTSGICHCRTCRRTGAAPMLPFVTFPFDRFDFTQGKPVDFHSSPLVTRSFCGRCGTPLTYRHQEQAGAIDVMTCSLDNPEAFP